MSSIFKGDVSRRSVLAGAGALGAASLRLSAYGC